MTTQITVQDASHIASVNIETSHTTNVVISRTAIGTMAHAETANTANTANYANFAGTAYSVAGANVSGYVANATHATIANSANSVAAGNISGTINFATYAGTANAVAGANVSGTVANAAHATTAGSATTAGTVTTNAQPNITSVGTLTGLTSSANISAPFFIGNIVGNISGNIVVPGSNTAVIYNTLGNAGASDAFKFDYAANVLTVVGNISATTFSGSGASLTSINGANVSEVANASYATTAGSASVAASANSVAGANVSGEVANAAYATTSGTAYSVAGGNVSGDVSGANHANVADVANSVAAGNISGTINYATYAGTANAVAGANVSGEVANAAYATTSGTAYSVAGGNVSGEVANAAYATNSGHSVVADSANSVAAGNISGTINFATYAGTANAVAGANVSGEVANAAYATTSGTAYSVSGGNVSGDVSGANHANVADVANSVSVANVSGIGNIATLNLDGNASNILYGNGVFSAVPDVSNVANANYANFAGTLINGTSNITIPVANGDINFSANGVANLAVLDTTGNLTVNNTIIAQSANLTGTYNIDSSGYYYSSYINLANAGAISLPSFYFSGDFTSGSNLVTNVVLTDGFASGYTFNLADYVTELTNSGVNWTTGAPPFDDNYYPINTIISSVDAPNNQIYLSNNASLSGSGIFNFTGTWLSNSSTNSYYVASAPFVTNAISTDATTNNISVTDFNTFNDGYINPGDSIQFIGTSFGNITAGVDYFVANIDYGNSTFSISTTNGGPDLELTTDTGNLIMVYNPFNAINIQPLSAGYYYAGPWTTTPVLTDFTQSPAGTINAGTILNFTGFIRPVDFNSNTSPAVQSAGQFTRIDNSLVVGDGSYGTPTLNGKLNGGIPVNGITLLHTGLDANLYQSRTNYQIVDYTDNSPGNPSITNPLNPPSVSFTSYNGNVNGTANDQYARSGRAIGRIAWYGSQQVGGINYDNPGSSPHAGIYVQALGDWNDSTNANLPMTMSFQYSPLNAATSGFATNYQRINRTFLQASNNSTYIGGATNIQFKPLARSGSGINNRSPSALGNVSINPQTFVDISGYTQGNAVSNGAGAVLNVTTTDSHWNGNVALRLSRTIGNTANIEFVLPQSLSNTLVLVNKSSGNTIATFTDGSLTVSGDVRANSISVESGGFVKYAAFTISALTAITGSVGQTAAVSDAGGKFAYWDTTNSRWSYVHDNSAV